MNLLIFIIIVSFLFQNAFCSLKFVIQNKEKRCFIENVDGAGVFMVKYNVGGFESETTEEEERHVSENFRFDVHKDGNDKYPFFSFTIKNKKGKQAINTEGIKEIKICFTYEKGISRKVKDHKDLYIGLKFYAENTQEQYSEQSLTKDAVNSFRGKVNLIKSIFNPFLVSQKTEMDQEDQTAKTIISTSTMYYYLAFIQIGIMLLVTLRYITMFKKMLFDNKLIESQ